MNVVTIEIPRTILFIQMIRYYEGGIYIRFVQTYLVAADCMANLGENTEYVLNVVNKKTNIENGQHLV